MQQLDSQSLGLQNEIKANPIKEKQPEQDEQIIAGDEVADNQLIKKPVSKFRQDFLACKDYSKKDQLLQTFPHLKSLDEAQQTDFNEIEDAYSFIIRSSNDDNIHKAIKYGLWCSTPPNNELLNEQFIKANKEGKKVFLFFSVVKSGQFVGVAELISNKHDESFDYWWQSGKQWKGIFQIKWLFIKDILYKHFDKLQNVKDDPVIRSKDGTMVDWKKTGQKMMDIFKNAPDQFTIFNDFATMDMREQYLRYMKTLNKNAIEQSQQPHQLVQQQQINYQGGYQQQMAPYQQGYYGMQQNPYPQQLYGRFNNGYPPQQYQQYNNNTSYYPQQNYYNNNSAQGPRNGQRNTNFQRNNNYRYNNGNTYQQNNPNYQGQKRQNKQ